MIQIFFLILFFIFIITPFAFPAYILFKFLFSKKLTQEPSIVKKKPAIDILIPAYNEEKIIKKTIDNLLNSNYFDFKITIVDDKSDDNTLEKLIELTRISDKIQVFSNKKRIGKKEILNKYIPKMKSDYVLVLDANLQVDKNCIKYLTSKLNEETALVYGKLILKKNRYSSVTDEEINYWNFETFTKILQSKCGNITSPVGGFYIIKKQNFSKIPANCSMEDMYLLIKNLENHKKVKFSKKAHAFELTSGSTVHEFNRKKRILSGAYFMMNYFIKNQTFSKLKKEDLTCFFINKIIRWIYPLIFFLTCFFSIITRKKLKLANTFFNLNKTLIFFTGSEFLINSFINSLTHKKRIRVKIFKKPLYFYMLMVAGILAFFEKQNPLWKKENR
ncbi:MAG: glycosyltransferase [Candidatus Muiribacteriota bacterium]